jgi:hypothetical protein
MHSLVSTLVMYLALARSAASREQRRLYQMARRRAQGTPTRAEYNAAHRARPRPSRAQVVAVEVVVPLDQQHPLYAKAMEALALQRAAFGTGATLVFPEEWIRDDMVQDAVLGMLEDRPSWLADARRRAAEERRRLRYQFHFDDGLVHSIAMVPVGLEDD